MISANSATLAAIKTGNSVKAIAGMTFEYNMNYMGETETSFITINNFAGGVENYPQTVVPGSPFKKLFPIDTIKKPFRPESAGIKYAIVGDVLTGSYKDPRNSQYSLQYRTYYPGQDNVYKYWLYGKGQAVDISMTYPKTILANKIVVRFELGHSIPESFTIRTQAGTIFSGNASNVAPWGSPNAGTVTIYYDGSLWSVAEPTTPASPVSITTLRLTVDGVVDKYLGIIELSPRWELDATQYLKSFSISKESSSSAEDLLPVGKITANSLRSELISFESSIKFKTFEKSLTSLSSSDIYLFKNLIIRPYIKVYESPTSSTYEKIKQGTYYLHSYTLSEYGDLSITALDSSKILQETVSPNLLCNGYTSPAIIRYMLDSIGFTNYNINLKSGTAQDTSIITPIYWWSKDDQTVWDALQEICRDSQMTAVFDENNILQFYTRDYLFDATRVSSPWEFRDTTGNGYSSNIISLEKEETPSSSYVKIVWQPAVTSEFDLQNSQLLWQSSGEMFLGGGALIKSLDNSETDYIELSPILPNKLQKDVVATTSLSGYFSVDDEIIEFEGAEYRYKNSDGIDQTPVIVKSKSELEQLKSLSKAGTIFPTNRFKIKTRGALGTTAKAHVGTGEAYSNLAFANGLIEWEVDWS